MRRRSSMDSKKNAGVLKVEALLALSLLVVAMNVASPLFHRVNHLTVDTQEYQFAINELSNQIDAIARLSPEQAAEALDLLSASPACKQTLADSSLVGSLSKDDLGTRVTLSLSWQDLDESNPLQLSAWLSSSDEEEVAP